jgi:hypothetical protein
MSTVWTQVRQCAETMQAMMEHAGYRAEDPSLDQYDWENHVYHSNLFRRGHVEVVDKTATHGIYILHATVFPHPDDPSPIWGFDAVCGKNKITGCFIDYSPTGDRDHPMIEYFAEEVGQYDWNKPRKLPEWAERIFSPYMIAAGNVSDETELAQITSLAEILVNHYTECVGETNNTAESTKDQQNYYAQNQKQNPHTPKVMVSLGLSQEDVQMFIQDCLFPELK